MNRKRAVTVAGEIAITTIGILIALAINSWWQGRQDHAFEAEILREMRSQLVGDTLDLRGDQDAYAMIRGAIEDLRRRFTAGSPYAPEVDSLTGVLVFGRTHISNSAAWQTLKTRGVGLIKDDSLRVGIATFFESSNPALALFNQLDSRILDDAIRPYYREHFARPVSIGAANDANGRATPRDFPALAKDPVFEYMLSERSVALQQALVMYDSTRLAAIRLIARIDDRLEK